MHKLIIHKETFSAAQRESVEQKLKSKLHQLNSGYETEIPNALDYDALESWRNTLNCDVNLLPQGFDPRQVKLVISDMDSTFINIECVDEIAEFAGVKDKVSKITEAAMRGELNFEQSLTERVALLNGLDESALQKVYDQRLRLNPGAEQMLQGLKQKGIRFALVSGGFTFFTSRLQKKYDLDYTLSNTLEINGGKLTGKVHGSIVGAEAKANFLLETCEELGILPNQAVAVGDGANDLKMMAEAGVGVAYHAKPKVQASADCVLNYSGLEGLLALLGN